jgi:uncharacterized membrane protein
MSTNITESFFGASTLAGGFGSFHAWRQEETWQFFILQFLAVAFALLISFRDARDKERSEVRRR